MGCDAGVVWLHNYRIILLNFYCYWLFQVFVDNLQMGDYRERLLLGTGLLEFAWRETHSLVEAVESGWTAAFRALLDPS